MARRWGRAGRSPLRSGGAPLQAQGKPEADEERCPLLGLGTTRRRRQKRVSGGESHPDPMAPPHPSWQRTPFSLGETRGPSKQASRTRSPSCTKGGAKAAAKLSRPGCSSSRPRRLTRWAGTGRLALPAATGPEWGWTVGQGATASPSLGLGETQDKPCLAGSEGSTQTQSSHGPRATMSRAEARAHRLPRSPPRRRLCSRYRRQRAPAPRGLAQTVRGPAGRHGPPYR